MLKSHPLLREELAKKGVEFMLEHQVESIDDKQVKYANADGSDSVDGDLVFVATGRKPNTKGFGSGRIGSGY